jgi:hypothetical protein
LLFVHLIAPAAKTVLDRERQDFSEEAEKNFQQVCRVVGGAVLPHV